jgi:hypothetical protein
MELKNTTPVPNWLFDDGFKYLNGSETKILLAIIRSTLGWYDPKTKKRKDRDWISHAQFSSRTGLSERSVTEAVKGLVEKQFIAVTDQFGKPLPKPNQRRFAHRIFYSLQNEITKSNAISSEVSYPKVADSLKYLPSTKEIQKKFSIPQNRRLSDQERYRQILEEQERIQKRRDNWN